MSEKILKISKLAFILYLVFTLLVVYAASYFVFLANFKTIEDEKNKNNIQTIVSKMNTDLDYLQSATEDYSKWDATYSFMENHNTAYSSDNFEEGEGTLDGLKVDFFLFSDKKNKIVFSTYSSSFKEKNTVPFEQEIVNKFKDYNTTNTVFTYNSINYYIVKSSISNNDDSVPSNGYIYSGKMITAQTFSLLAQSFKHINLTHKNTKNNSFYIDTQYLKNIQVHVEHDSHEIHNNIKFFRNNDYVFSINTTSARKIVKKGRETIIVYNIFISIFLLIIFFIIYKYKSLLESYNKELSEDVEIKTKQLSKALEDIEAKNEELTLLANKDFLTKIDNRRSFFKQSEDILQNPLNADKSFSVVMIDLDKFKDINDRYTHEAGDKVLVHFCEIVTSIIDAKSIFGRLGGEEFAIFFVDKTKDESYKISECIRTTCKSTPVCLKDQEINFTVSCGLFPRENNESIDELIEEADRLLYKAKDGGRNKIVRAFRK